MRRHAPAPLLLAFALAAVGCTRPELQPFLGQWESDFALATVARDGTWSIKAKDTGETVRGRLSVDRDTSQLTIEYPGPPEKAATFYYEVDATSLTLSDLVDRTPTDRFLRPERFAALGPHDTTVHLPDIREQVQFTPDGFSVLWKTYENGFVRKRYTPIQGMDSLPSFDRLGTPINAQVVVEDLKTHRFESLVILNEDERHPIIRQAGQVEFSYQTAPGGARFIAREGSSGRMYDRQGRPLDAQGRLVRIGRQPNVRSPLLSPWLIGAVLGAAGAFGLLIVTVVAIVVIRRRRS